MPLTTALYTGMSGLNANQTALDVIGNNISNVNTTAFKGSRALFQPEFSETYSFGTSPRDSFGGSNPSQKGLGVRVGTIQTNFANGNVKLTGIKTDMAIDGDGMFVVEDSERYYTRSGHFDLNGDNYLVTADGKYVMGYGVDANYNIVEGSLDRLRIPMNKITVANATSTVVLDGQLGGTELTKADSGTTLTSSKLRLANDGAIDGSTLLVDLLRIKEGLPAGEQVFFDGTQLSFNGQRGGRYQGPRTLDVTTTTTVQDLQDFMVNAFGVDTSAEAQVAGATPAGSVINLVSGTPGTDAVYAFDITGNVGEENYLQMGTGGLQSTDTTITGPLTFTQSVAATGDSVYTSMNVYDSLGNPLEVDLTFVYENEDNTGRTWRFYANSTDDTDVSTVLGSGTIKFDTQGQFVEATDTLIEIDRDMNGVLTPVAITLDMSRIGGISQDSEARVQMATQDGEPAGTLTDFFIADDGTIMGSFNNGSTRQLGQVAIATMPNYAGLIDAGESLYKVGPNSGEAVVGTPLTNGAGSVVGGAVETSNVDISREFIEMITASTGFSASSKVITTSNQLLTELLSLVR